ncbi:Histidine kinase-, DNA gyrase B-, and HSP90-like ATPase [Terribacillus halophilus]|uniref:Histidine kinase-, DNA gyrase B-, and HSP90-like ATPase n=1 Tax=Terribacillus halophilus TaxID=361279 RepID=A0A1G6L473_9BACI|nr:ATP-binding protein [Terribacillus halophilus]SDC38112.1 Histidine kinase-, DNA gyrase B-, and HSP90-like ATPase [Terribacillus halophilus]
MTVINKKVVPPHAIRTIEGLRDTGYEFNTAMADIIDNSIAANASKINVTIEMDFMGDINIFIADNGIGMNEQGIEAAMTYGSPKRENQKSLGKFGLGLKTASTAFCRSLTVTTRDSGDSQIYKARWDLDHVAEADDWELLLLDPIKQEIDMLDDISNNGSGTIVTWEKVDRLLKDYQDPSGTYARRALEKIVDNLKEHVAMVYQRFLDPRFVEAPDVNIKINNELIEPWDPFCTDETNTEVVAEELQEVEFEDGTQTEFSIKAYVLPRKEEFSSDEMRKNAKLSNDLQGFYIYRENRLIHYGNWLGMYTNEPHGTLLRVEFSFEYLMDEAFNVDIKKSNISLSTELYNWLREQFLPAPRRAANERYRKGQKKSVQKASKGAHDTSNKGIGNREKDLKMSDLEVNEDTNDVQVTNKKGKVRIKLPILKPAKAGELYVSPVDSIEDGLLWEPALIDTKHAVTINTNHSYYRKVYIPNLNSSVIVQGMDSLLWALSEAELGTISEDTKHHLKELRYEVSRILRRLVEDLPEPELDNHEEY